MKILVISLAGIGDTLIATPLIHELRANFPDARMDAFVLWKGSKDLLQGNPHLNGVHQQNLITSAAADNIRFLARLRKNHYDISINTHPQSRIHYRVIARIIGASLRLSHQYDRRSPLDRFLVNRWVPQDYEVHGVENNLRLLQPLEARPRLENHQFEVFLSAEEQKWSTQFLARHRLDSRFKLGIHVGSGGTKNLPLKRWPLEQYVALINRLADTHPDVAILLFGGPEEVAAHEQIRRQCPHPALYAPDSSDLRQAAALLGKCNSFLSVDTALMHLAAAMKVPNQIVIEAPTLNATNLPYQNPFTLVPNPVVAGRNLEYYRYDGGPIRGTQSELVRCMRSVTVDAVHKALIEALPGTSS